MAILKLIHPRLGICAQRIITPVKTTGRIKFDWKHKYGKKYFECIVIVKED
jgi:hypothetical protein